MTVCPSCGEALRQDWLRPLLVGAGTLLALLLVFVVGSWLVQRLEGFRPSQALSAMQAVASDVPVLVEIPTLTPSLTPSITPSPTPTPTSTPEPSATPVPTLTPTPTWTPSPVPTDTPSPTPTQTRRPATLTPTTAPTLTPTPLPTVAPPVPLEPENGAPQGEGDIFKLAWRSTHTLKPDECYLVTVRYTHEGSATNLQSCVQQTSWWVDESLYGEADQETDRVYYWQVQIVSKGTDEAGQEVYVPLGPPSEEWRFYWR